MLDNTTNQTKPQQQSQEPKPYKIKTNYPDITTIKDLAELYLAGKHNLRVATINTYEHLFKPIYTYFEESFDYKQITLMKANLFIRYLKEQKYSLKTVKEIGVLLKKLYKFASQIRLITASPIETLTLPIPQKRKPQYLLEEDIVEFMIYLTPQNRLPVLIALSCGLRKGEVRQLKWSMVSFKNQEFFLPAEICKSKEDKIVPFPNNIKTLLEKHQKENAYEYLFPNKTKTGPRADFRRNIKTAFRKIGKPTFSFHKLRSSFATRFISEFPEALYELSQICGWRDLETAKRYLADNIVARKKRLKKINGVSLDFEN